MTEGKVTGSAAVSNMKIRRNEKNDRERQKVFDAVMQEKMEQERVEWAPKDKEDEKFQKKMANKMQD